MLCSRGKALLTPIVRSYGDREQLDRVKSQMEGTKQIMVSIAARTVAAFGSPSDTWLADWLAHRTLGLTSDGTSPRGTAPVDFE